MSDYVNGTVNRRSFFDRVGGGLYGAALAQLLAADLPAAERRIHDLQPHQPLHEPQANSVIHLFMNGGPSQMDLFDPKEELNRRHGEAYFKEIAGKLNSSTLSVH